MSQIRLSKVRILKARISQIRTLQVYTPQVRLSQVRRTQVRTTQVRISQVRTTQVRFRLNVIALLIDGKPTATCIPLIKPMVIITCTMWKGCVSRISVFRLRHSTTGIRVRT